MKNILMLCTGNTCRSPMAERIARHLALRRGLMGQYVFASAGLSAFSGQPMSTPSIEVLGEIGVDGQGHCSANAAGVDLSSYDEIHAMTEDHKRLLLQIHPELTPKVLVLGVKDPYGGTLDDYRRARDEIYQFYEGYFA